MPAIDVSLMLAEVMDKQRSIPEILSISLILGILGYFVCLKWPKCTVGAVGVLVFLGYIQLSDIHHPAIWKAIVEEGGHSYYGWIYFSFAMSVALPLVGFWMARKRAGQRP